MTASADIKPIGTNVVVAIEHEDGGNVIVPDSAKEESMIVTVLAIGSLVEYIEVGNKVIVPFIGGSIVDNVRVLDAGEIMGVVYD